MPPIATPARRLSNELGLPVVDDVATGAAGAAFAVGVGMDRPRGCDDAEDATEAGRPPEEGANPSIGGEAVDERLGRCLCVYSRGRSSTATGEVGDVGGGGGDLARIDRRGWVGGERALSRRGMGDAGVRPEPAPAGSWTGEWVRDMVSGDGARGAGDEPWADMPR
jgi:hypothetical protein